MSKKFRYSSFSRKIFIIFNTLFMIFLVAAVLLPVLKVFNDSLVNHSVFGIRMFDEKPDIAAYKFLFKEPNIDFYRKSIINQLLIMFATTAIGTFVSVTAAYVLAQRDMPGSGLLGKMLIFTSVFGAGMVPEMLTIKKLGLLDSPWAVILPMTVNVLNIYILRDFFENLPQSIFEAAEIDGCSPMKTLFCVVLPLSKAPVAAVSLSFAAAAWNEYLRYVIYLSRDYLYNMYISARSFIGVDDGIWLYTPAYANMKTLWCAADILYILPILLLYPLFMKFCVPAFSESEIKL